MPMQTIFQQIPTSPQSAAAGLAHRVTSAGPACSAARGPGSGAHARRRQVHRGFLENLPKFHLCAHKLPSNETISSKYSSFPYAFHTQVRRHPAHVSAAGACPRRHGAPQGGLDGLHSEGGDGPGGGHGPAEGEGAVRWVCCSLYSLIHSLLYSFDYSFFL